ncbi:oligosaccharide flippase family protein [Beduinella massiliensis]|uniref:oligosaccharide flippase family protein n=1 Tax=Beduinella massiliensis TaxID=1852363 RepID=UPI000C844157
MNENKQYRLGAVLSYVLIALNIVISLFFTPYIMTVLGRDQAGLYQVIGNFVSYISVMDFGLGNAIIRYVAKYRAEGKKRKMEGFLGMAMSLYLAIGAVVLLAGGVCYAFLPSIFPNFTPENMALAKPMFLLLVFNMTLSLVMNVFPGVLAGFERFVLMRTLSIVRVVLRAIILVVMLPLGANVLHMVILDTALNLLFTLIQFGYALIKLRVRIRFFDFDKPLLREITTYSAFIFLNMLMEQMYWKVDSTIIGILYTTTTVTVTTIGTMIAEYFMQFSSSLSGLFLPKATQMVVRGASMEELTDMMIRIGRIQLMIIGLLVVGFVSVGHQFLACWVGDSMGADVDQSYAIATMLILALTIPLFQNTGISIVQAMNRHAFRSVVLVCVAALNVAVSIVLAKLYGPVGAAAGTVLSLLIGNVGIINWYYYKMIGLNIPRFFRETLRGILPALALLGGVGALTFLMPIGGWGTLLVRILLICACYVPLMYCVGMNAEEKKTVQKLLRRVRA